MPADRPEATPPHHRSHWTSQLPARLERLRDRGRRLQSAWDVNLVQRLADDAAALAAACDELGLSPLAADLDGVRGCCAALLDPPRIPDTADRRRLEGSLERLAGAAPPPTRDESLRALAVPGPTHEHGVPLRVVPPPGFVDAQAGAPAPRAPTPVAAAATASPPVRAATAGGDRATVGATACARDTLLREIADHLVADAGGVRPGGLVVFAPDGSEPRDPANEAARIVAMLRAFCAVAQAGDRVASDGGGRYLLFNRTLDAAALEAHAARIRERITRAGAPLRRFDAAACPVLAGTRQAITLYEAARDLVLGMQAQGRHGVFVVEDASRRTGGLADEIANALAGHGFEILFQPIVSLLGEEGERFQALLRLRSADGTLHSAADLVPAAQAAGLIADVDAWMLEQCLARLAGRADDSLRLFVSQSLATLREPRALTRLEEGLRRHAVAPAAIVIEVRASEAIDAPADVQRYAQALHALGASLAIAGVDADLAGMHPLPVLGAGYAKLATPPAQDAGEPFSALLEHLHALGAQVIAPRVEDARGIATLCRFGVDLVQGNFVQAADSDLAFDFRGARI